MRAIELILAYLYGKPQNQVIEADNKPFVLELTEPEKDEVETMKHSYEQVINQEVNETNGKADVSL
jgi:vacuolar-type H+-ATPase subunit F/Vma7